MWVAGAVPVSAWPGRVVSKLQFLPTHADWTRSPGCIYQKEPGQENAEALALVVGFGKAFSQEHVGNGSVVWQGGWLLTQASSWHQESICII